MTLPMRSYPAEMTNVFAGRYPVNMNTFKHDVTSMSRCCET